MRWDRRGTCCQCWDDSDQPQMDCEQLAHPMQSYFPSETSCRIHELVMTPLMSFYELFNDLKLLYYRLLLSLVAFLEKENSEEEGEDSINLGCLVQTLAFHCTYHDQCQIWLRRSYLPSHDKPCWLATHHAKCIHLLALSLNRDGLSPYSLEWPDLEELKRQEIAEGETSLLLVFVGFILFGMHPDYISFIQHQEQVRHCCRHNVLLDLRELKL